MEPTDVATYAAKDSRALSLVDTEDLLSELRFRGTESCTLGRLDIIEKLKKTADTCQKTYENSI